MKNNKYISLALVCATLVLVSCGKDELNRQESQRNTFDPALRGTWSSLCQRGQIESLTFDGDKITRQTVSFVEQDCRTKKQTLSVAGTYKLAHNFKEGVLNSIVITTGNALVVNNHTELTVRALNTVRTRIQALTEAPIPGTLDDETRLTTTRSNELIREAKKIVAWEREKAQTLNSMQVEKYHDLNAQLPSNTILSARSSARYEVDNGVLQLSGDRDIQSGSVFVKQ